MDQKETRIILQETNELHQTGSRDLKSNQKTYGVTDAALHLSSTSAAVSVQRGHSYCHDVTSLTMAAVSTFRGPPN